MKRRNTAKRRGQQRKACKRWRDKAFTRRPELVMFYNAKQRAVALRLPFDLLLEDIEIPLYCPALGIRLVRGAKKLHAGSPTLDRFVPALGYTKGNVAVISHLANTIKQNVTVEHLERVVKWMRSVR